MWPFHNNNNQPAVYNNYWVNNVMSNPTPNNENFLLQQIGTQLVATAALLMASQSIGGGSPNFEHERQTNFQNRNNMPVKTPMMVLNELAAKNNLGIKHFLQGKTGPEYDMTFHVLLHLGNYKRVEKYEGVGKCYSRALFDAAEKALSNSMFNLWSNKRPLSECVQVNLPSKAVKFKSGDKVFVKTEDYPYWPARIEELDDEAHKSYKVLLFGTQEIGFVLQDFIVLFDANSEFRYGEIHETCSYIEDFKKGMKEIRGELIEPIETISSPIPLVLPTTSQPLKSVRFEKLFFLKHLFDLKEPLKMTKIEKEKNQSFNFSFNMQPDHVSLISGTRIKVDGHFEYPNQIHLRFGWFDPEVTQPDNLPPNLKITVNGESKGIILPAPKPISKPGQDLIRPGRSIDITSLCKLAPGQLNKCEIKWTSPFPDRDFFCVGVCLFEKVSVESLIAHLKSNCVQKTDFTRQMVRKQLAKKNDGDIEIETNRLKVSLNCPLAKFRMKIPGRSQKCGHVQSFDLEAFLRMNEIKPNWFCPICDLPIQFEDLFIDKFFADILIRPKYNFDEIQFSPDAKWKKARETKSSKKEEIAVVVVSGDSDCETL